MKYADLVATSRTVARTRSRLEKRDRLAELLGRLQGEEIGVGVSHLAGILPQGKVGVGGAALARLEPGEPPAAPALDLLEVERRIAELAGISGPGSKRRREEALGGLFARATPDERRFLTGLLTGELRQGALVGVMVDAVAEATGIDADRVRRAAMLAGDVPRVATAMLVSGEGALEDFALRLFQPVLPMLASPAADVAAALERVERASFEVKLDGARIQVHKSDDAVRVYTRRLHDVTARVPEVVEAVESMPARELILDGETIALGPDGRPAGFQTTMRRFGRRQGVEALREALPLSSYFFDLLLLDGETLIDAPARERIERLEAVVGSDHRVPRIETTDETEALDFYEEVLRRGHEGLMAKDLAAPYAAGSRGFAWQKLKPAHTLDLVVLAVEAGSGRRRGWLSNLHLGARNPRDGSFVMLGKTFKGLTDAMLEWQTERLSSLAIGQEGHVTHVRPELVVEIAFSNVQTSPQYSSGLSLRFARVKAHRPDKPASEAATIDEVRAIHDRENRQAAEGPES